MKRTYHTDVQIRFKLGILSNEIRKQIPCSTLHNWKQKDFSTIFATETVYDSDENLQMIKEFLTRKRLLQAAKALYFIYQLLQLVVKSMEYKKLIFIQYKHELFNTIEKTKHVLGLERVLGAFDISYQWYYKQLSKQKCLGSPLDLCRKKYPGQLTVKEINTIKRYLADHLTLHWSLCSVYYKMMREKAAFMHISSFYKYAKLMGFKRQKTVHRRKRHTLGIRADKILQIIHCDTTIFRPINNVKVYIYFLVDNFSRNILSWKASLEYSAEFVFENLKEFTERFDLPNLNCVVDLIVDDGVENKAKVDDFVATTNINKLIAQKDITYSNSMIEAVNKRIKYDYLFTKELQNYEQTVEFLKTAVEEYNNKPHYALYGLTPNEVLANKIPDKHLFKTQIEKARKARVMENSANTCKNHL